MNTETNASTGPRTEAGKQRSRLNAVRHGLTGQSFVFAAAEASKYTEHSHRIHAHYQPQGPIESALTRQIADGIWRLDRASAIEHGLFAMAFDTDAIDNELDATLAPARTWQQEGKNLALLTLYVKRIENKLAANKAELARLQNVRHEAELLAAQTLAAPQPHPVPAAEPDPPQDQEFDFSGYTDEDLEREVQQLGALMQAPPAPPRPIAAKKMPRDRRFLLQMTAKRRRVSPTCLFRPGLSLRLSASSSAVSALNSHPLALETPRRTLSLSTVRCSPALLALASFLFTPLALAQTNPFEGQKITVIAFDPREQPVDASELHDILPIKTGDLLTSSTVRDAIQRLFSTGAYADIQVHAQAAPGGVSLTFVTRNSWFIGHVGVAGKIATPPTVAQLEDVSGLNLGQPYDDSLTQTAVTAQKRLMEVNGLYQPDIHPVFTWDNEYQRINIRFDVQPGPRARFTFPVVTGDLKMDPNRIAGALKLRRWLIHTWKPVTQTRVRQGLEGVRNLYLKDHRLEAKVTLQNLKYDPAADTVAPDISISSGPRIQVNAVGAKLSQSKIQKYVPIFEERTVDNDLLTEGARNLRDYYQSEGYFDVDVEFKEQRVINDQQAIDYLITTGERHRVVLIQIAGNKYFPTDALRDRMYLRTASFLQFPHGRYSDNLIARDEDAFKTLYQSNGFRDVVITHRVEDNYRGKQGDLAVYVNIQEGPQYHIANLVIKGISHLKLETVRAQLSSTENQPFSEYTVAVDRDAILALYFEQGFANAAFEWNSKPAAGDHLVDLEYDITEGTQQFVRQVVYSGNRYTRAQLIDSQLELNPGDPLSPAKITDTQRRLYDLRVFERVDAAIENPDGDLTKKYVLFDLNEARRYSFAVGFGAEFARIGGCQTCLDAPAGETGFSPRVSFNASRNNLWGLGHSLVLDTRISTLEQRASLTYNWPRFFGSQNTFLDSRLLRRFPRRAHLLLQARRGHHPNGPPRLQSHHGLLQLHLPPRQRRSSQLENHAPAHPAFVAARASRFARRFPHSRPPR